MVHDSAQLKLLNITTLIKSYGTVRKLIIVQGLEADTKHGQRLAEIIRIAGVSGKQLICHNTPETTFAVRCNLIGEFDVIDNRIPLKVVRIPDIKKRQAVCEVNNFFLTPNSQSLRLDIQYINGQYAPVRALDKSESELLKTVEEQPDFFFQNLAFLSEAHDHGLLVLSPEFLSLVETYDLKRLRTSLPNNQDKATQLVEHKHYLSNKSIA